MSRFELTLGTGVSRRAIALSPAIWLVVGLFYAVLGGVLLVIPFLDAELSAVRIRGLGIFLIGCSAVLLRMRPPEPDAPATHATLVLSYVMPALAISAFAPRGSLALGSAVFVGPLAAVWIVNRLELVLHLGAAAIALSIPALLGQLDTATVAGLVLMVPPTWALCASCLVVLEAAEKQGERLDWLVRRDPLTGVGNRRMLDEELALELTRHRAGQRSLSVLALDLNGFKALNDTVGHAAGDELLRAVADQLTRAARKHDVVIRQGGDEFCMVLPDTTAAEAEAISSLVRSRLSKVVLYGNPISAGIGVASFPIDGVEPGALLDVADERLRINKAAYPARGTPLATAPDSSTGPATQPTSDADAVGPAASAAGPGQANELGGLTRHDLAESPVLWRETAAVVLLYSMLGFLIYAVAPGLRTTGVLALCLGGTAVGLWYLATSPPAEGSLRYHAVLASTYLLPAAVFIGTRPQGAMVVGLAIWIGPLVAVRCPDRRAFAAHCVAATVVFLSLGPLGLVEPIVTIALLLMVGTMWVLGVCCVVVLEAIEAQGAELSRLVRTDPLTGAANRRQLEDELKEQLIRHRRSREPLSVLALDLNGFKAVNDTVGHAAGDELLKTVAQELESVVGERGTVARPGGDEFTVLLPACDADAADAIVVAIRTRLGAITVAALCVRTGVGAATFPADGSTASQLLGCADDRLRENKYGPEQASDSAEALDDRAASDRS